MTASRLGNIPTTPLRFGGESPGSGVPTGMPDRLVSNAHEETPYKLRRLLRPVSVPPSLWETVLPAGAPQGTVVVLRRLASIGQKWCVQSQTPSFAKNWALDLKYCASLTRHRCQADPTHTVSMAARNPSCASRMASLTPRSPLATRLRKTPAKTRHPRSFPNQNPKLPVHGMFDANRDHKRHSLYTPAFPNFRKGRVKPNVRIFPF